MSNGHGNCIFAVCCPPESEEQITALAEEMTKGLDPDTRVASFENIARWVLATYDLAPKGSLQAFKDSIRDYAREGHVKAAARGDGREE